MKNLSNGETEGSDPVVFTPQTPEEIKELVGLFQRQVIRINSLEHTNTLLACRVSELEETVGDLSWTNLLLSDDNK